MWRVCVLWMELLYLFVVVCLRTSYFFSPRAHATSP